MNLKQASLIGCRGWGCKTFGGRTYRGNVIKRKESGSWMQWIGASRYLELSINMGGYLMLIRIIVIYYCCLGGSCGNVKMNGKHKTVRFLLFLLFVDSLLPHTSGVYYLLGLNTSSFSFIRMI